MKNIFAIFFVLLLVQCSAFKIKKKGTSDVASTEKIETRPEFPGGMDKMFDYLSKNIKYPTEALNEGIQGKVYVEFVVEKDGSISNSRIIRGIGYGCDKEALRVINEMPNWAPGTLNGEPVRVKHILPLNFKLK